MPESNVACSDVAIAILDEIEDEELKAGMIKRLVRYYERSYILEKKGWEIVPKEVDKYPRASWWNYSDVDSFTYGNPNPEIIGFLYRYQIYLKKLNIKTLVENMIDYLNDGFDQEKSQHSIISSLYFYHKLDDVNKARIKAVLTKAVKEEMELEDWDKYCLEPYLVYLAEKEFVSEYHAALKKNLMMHEKQLENGLIMPNWTWGQFPEVFEKIKYEWAGFLTYRTVKALMKFKKDQ